MFKGYIPTKGKKPLEEYKNRTEFYSYDYIIHQKTDYGGILDDNIIQIDIDDMQQSELLYKIIKNLQIKCSTLKTERGRHFYFINPGITRRKQGYYTPIGIKVDIGLGSQNAVIPLKINGKTRRLTECDNPQELPKWLYPINKTSIDFEHMSEGDGRNQALFNYILTLQGTGMSVPDIKETIKIINKYILQQPLPEHEIDTILRDEAFMKQSFYIKGKLQYEDLAKYLIENQNIIKIDDVLHIYKDGVYTDKTIEIEKIMLKYLNNPTRSIRAEIISYLQMMCEDKQQAPSRYILLNNGIYDLETKKLLPLNPKIIIKNKIPWNYNPEAYDVNVDRVLNKISCNNKSLRLLLEEIPGYMLLRSCELSKAFLLKGPKASNGKSTYLDMIMSFIGKNNTSTLALEELNQRFKTTELYGKLANIGDDISNKYIKDNSVFKKLVTGNPINVERKGKDPFDFENYSKLIFSCNNLPKIDDKSDGLYRRLLIIPFNAKFTKDDSDFDPFIKYKLQTNSAMEYLLKLALNGLYKILSDNGFDEIKETKIELADYKKLNNPVLEFLEQFKVVNETTDDSYLRYSNWCIENGYKSVNSRTFVTEVKAATGYNIKQIRIPKNELKPNMKEKPYIFIK